MSDNPSVPDFALPPDHPRRSLHHTSMYRSEQEWWDDMFGKGPSDPDVVGHYPGQTEDSVIVEDYHNLAFYKEFGDVD